MKLRAYPYFLLPWLLVDHALAGDPPTDEWGPVTNNVQMAISVTLPWNHTFRVGETNVAQEPVSVKREVKAGEPFSLLVRIRNLSTNATLSFFNGGTYQNIDDGLACVVVSPSGKDVSPTMAPAIRLGSGSWIVVSPNQIVEFEFPLWRPCKLGEIGTYRITARKSTYARKKGEKEFVLTSNTLCVSVVPEK